MYFADHGFREAGGLICAPEVTESVFPAGEGFA